MNLYAVDGSNQFLFAVGDLTSEFFGTLAESTHGYPPSPFDNDVNDAYMSGPSSIDEVIADLAALLAKCGVNVTVD